ncbi:AMP-dependent synthetase/ligase [Bacillus sp. FJAT-45350]|uniref:AMP-dependent synthetase/ligase n=1 Tax=Bacillus sp. FJAT-45350 TaxID=2011014 RepID=UPI000BB72AFE|nr:AMP-binding protein [Bacillus sp. FJAT-45350]
MSTDKTLPKLLLERGTTSKETVALRQKKLGIWNEITWREYLENVKNLSAALSSECGFEKGDRLAILGDNRPHWVYSELAAQSIGGIVVGIYQESLPDQLVYYLNHCEAKIVIAEDQEQVDKLLEIEEKIPLVEKIIYYNDKSLRSYKNSKLFYMSDLQKKGEVFVQKNPTYFEEQVNKVNSEDIAIISYTAGTSGKPKGVMLSHSNLLATAHSLSEVDRFEENNDQLSFLPLAWIGEQVISVTMSLYKNVKINFSEEPTTVLSDLREIGPHTMFAPPKTYENIISRFKLRMDGSSWLKKKVYNFFKSYGDKVAKAKVNNESISFGTKLMYVIGDFLVFSAIRDHIGLARIKRAYSGGGSLGTDAVHFFQAHGINVKQCYGATEVCGVSFLQRDNDINERSVGVPLPSTEVMLSENEVVLVKSPSVFKGYYKDDISYKNNVQDGWVSLGDRGELDENGHLYITDPLEDIQILSNGEKVAPTEIENKLKHSRFIKEAIVFGKAKPYLVSMINIDMANVGRWAEKNQIVYTTYADLSTKKEVISLIEKEVASIMKDLPESMRVKKIVILHKELDADDEELTRTQKVRRSYLEEKYQIVFDGLYSSSSQLRLKINDGNDAETDLQVIDLEANKEVA